MCNGRQGSRAPRSGFAMLEPEQLSPQRLCDQSRLVPLIIATALFMENTDSTVIATSLPMIAQDLGEDPIALKLALTSYLVSLAIFIPISGWMADRSARGRSSAPPSASSWLGSLACACVEFARRLRRRALLPGHGRRHDGAGRPARPPAQRARSEVVQALATLTIPALVGPVVGPPLGGFITTYFDWRWIFFINIPIGILGIVLSTVFIPEHQGSRTSAPRRRRLPALGLGLAAADAGSCHRRAASRSRSRPRSAAWSLGTVCLVALSSCTRGGRPHPVIQLEPPEDPDLPRPACSAASCSASASARFRSCCR